MGKVSAAGSRVYLDQYALGGYLNSVEFDLKQETAKTDCFTDAGPRKVAGNFDHDHKFGGFFDDASGAIDDLLFNTFSTDVDHYLAECFGSDAEGSVVLDSVVEIAERPRKAQVGGAVLLDFTATGRGQATRGLVLRNATLVATGSGTGQDGGAGIASGHVFAVVFRLLAFTGTNITLAVDHSTDNSSWTTNLVTSGALTVVGASRVTTTSAVNRYRRVTASGTFTSAQVLVTAGQVLGS